MAASLPHELILEVLSRLPAKSLLRFRCVCKPWYSSIHDPNFIKMHLNRAIEEDAMNLFLASKPFATMSRTFPLLEKRMYCLEGDSFDQSVQFQSPVDFDFRILGTCNGLVCLCSKNLVCLLNPCTREYKMVKFDKEFSFTGKYVYGLGFDNEDYVLVQLVYSGDSDYFIYSEKKIEFKSEVNLYSLNDTSCSTISNIPYRVRNGKESSGIYLNGYLHWLGRTKTFSPLTIISFSNSKKVFREMPLSFSLGRDANMTMGALRGQLFIYCAFYRGDTELWVMKNYGVADSWMKLFSMEKTLLPRAPSLRVLCFTENGKLLLKDGKKLVIYDLKREKLWNVRYSGIHLEKICRRICHVASLVPLNSGTYVGAVAGVKVSKKRKERVWLLEDAH